MKKKAIGLEIAKKSLHIPHPLFLEFGQTTATEIIDFRHIRVIVQLKISCGASYWYD